MATIGQALTAPESGWARFDNCNSNIQYSGTWTTLNNTSHYRSSIQVGSVIDGFVKFRFYGTKFRVMACTSATGRCANVEVSVDESIIGSFSEITGSTMYQVMIYECTGLTDGLHTVTLKQKTASGFYIDSIDIDDTGKLIHHFLDPVSDMSNIQFGQYIPCKYTAPSGQAGTFSDFNGDSIDYIPTIPPATPNGYFNFIFAGYDTKNRMKFIADVSIQSIISWDTLNTMGVASADGIEIDLGLGAFYRSKIKLMSGGTNSSDPYNDYDYIIANSTLGGYIAAGDDTIWHWSSGSMWTSSQYSTSGSKTTKGGTSVNTISSVTPSSTTSSFRPMLTIESLNPAPILNNPLKTIIDPHQVQISATSVQDLLGETVKYKVEIIKSDNSIVIKKDYDATLQASPYAFQTVTFGLSDFDYGTNKIRVTMKDQNGFWSTWETLVIKSNMLKSLIRDGNSWKYINGDMLSTAVADYTTASGTDKESAFLLYGMGTSVSPSNTALEQVVNDNFYVMLYKATTLT